MASFNMTFDHKRDRRACMALLFGGALVCAASAGHAQTTDSVLGDWPDTPENPALQEVCKPQLTYATAIAGLLGRHASAVEFLRWEEGQAEQAIANNPTADAFDMGIGTVMIITSLVTHGRFDEQIYSRIPGGFPQWAYRSCLKGKPLA